MNVHRFLCVSVCLYKGPKDNRREITLQDINDNAPIFTTKNYNINISEVGVISLLQTWPLDFTRIPKILTDRFLSIALSEL